MMSKRQWDETIGYNDKEEYLVAGIKKYLLSYTQKVELFTRDISIEDILNGRTEERHQEFIQELFKDWNSKLGWKEFGF